MRSTYAATPSTGWAQARSCSRAWTKASTRTIRRRSSSGGPNAPAVIGQARAGHGRAPAGVGLDDLIHELEVAVQDGQLAVDGRVQGARGDDLVVRERDHDVGRFAGGGVDQVRAPPAVGGAVVEDVVLGGLFEAVVGEPDRLG